MSKIGRKPIDTTGVQVDITGNEIHYKGPKATGVYVLPEGLAIDKNDAKLRIVCSDKDKYAQWGLHRALLANKINGALKGFEQKVTIVGLGYKALQKGPQVVEFSLGYSHKISFDVPKDITIDIDKTGQNLIIKGADKEQTGHVADMIRSLRPPEPYKGTGIKLAEEEILRKAGKAKAGS